ncbi:MAG TPA: alpha/beta hydrolase [Acidimicrobiales bacterium]
MDAIAGGERGVVPGDVALRYDEWGAGAGDPPLVLVHGYTGSAADWVHVAPVLGRRRRVLAYDQRGHGDSGRAGAVERYSFDLLVDDLVRFLDHLGLDRVDLLGHSMGGVIALRLALDHPARVRSLVLMDTGAEPAGAMPMAAIEGLTVVGRSQGMPAAYEVIVAELGAPSRARRRRGQPTVEDEVADRERDERVARSFARLDPDAFLALGRELDCYPSLIGRLGEVACPVTVMVGERDTGLRGSADVLADRIPGARLAVVPAAGHSPQEDEPEAWIAVVEEHLAG